MDTLAVVLLTYNRLEYAKRTLESLLESARFVSQNHKVLWHVASDGDSQEYLDGLVKGTLFECVYPEDVSQSNSHRGGYGKNYNVAMQTVHPIADWVLPLEDDWELMRGFCPDDIISDMRELDIGCARLGYIGYTQELRGRLVWGSKCGHWLMFDPASSEPHVFAGHPRIESREWSRNVGPWPEGKLPGETEFEVAHRWAARSRVAWPLDIVKPSGDLWAHIGTVRSY